MYLLHNSFSVVDREETISSLWMLAHAGRALKPSNFIHEVSPPISKGKTNESNMKHVRNTSRICLSTQNTRA